MEQVGAGASLEVDPEVDDEDEGSCCQIEEEVEVVVDEDAAVEKREEGKPIC